MGWGVRVQSSVEASQQDAKVVHLWWDEEEGKTRALCRGGVETEAHRTSQ